MPRLPGAARARRWPRWSRRRRCSRSCCRGSSTRSPSRARSRSCSTTSTGCRARSTRESVAWFVDHLPATRPARALDPHRPGAAARHAARPRPAARAARRRPALHRRRGRASSSTGASGSSSTPADVELLVARTEGWPAGIYLAALSLAGSDRQARPRRARSTARAPTSSTSSPARCSRPTSPDAAALHAAHVGARAAVRAAVRRRARRAGLGRARSRRSPARTCSCSRSTTARRWFRFHHLFAQILRVELERREPGLVPDAAPPRVRVARRARHDRRGDPPRRRGGRVRRGRAADRRDAGSTTPTPAGPRRCSSGCARFPEPILDADAAAAARPGLGRGAARPRGRHARRRRPCPRARRARRGSAARRLRLAGVQPVGARPRRSAGATCRAILEHGTRSAELEGPDSPWRPVITWALGWAHYCDGDLDAAERWLRETTALAPPAEPVDRRRRRDRRPVADRGPCAASATSRCASRRRRSTSRASCGLLDARRGRRGPHGATASRWPRTAAATRRSPSSSSGVFLRRLWGQPLDLVDGLHRAGRRRGRASATGGAPTDALRRGGARSSRGCAGPGALPARLAAARRAARLGAAPASDALSERELTVLRLLSGGLTEREIGRELFLSFNTVHSHVKVDLPQARRVVARRGGRAARASRLL